MVKHLAEAGVASSQDAVVDQAVSDYARRVRDAEEARLWKEAADDPAFMGEMRELWAEFEAEDRAAWER